MTEKEVNAILQRDAPGWRVAPDAKLPQAGETDFAVAAENGSGRRSVFLISNGRVRGAQG